MSRYSEDQSSLGDFGGGERIEPPLVHRKAIKYVKHNGERRLAGFVGKETKRDRVVYTAYRTGSHYYYDGDGYALSDRVVKHCQGVGVSIIYVHEAPSGGTQGDVWTFRTRDYARKGQQVPEDVLDDPRDTQTYLSTDMAVRRWPDHSEELFIEDFETAMERLTRKYEESNW